MNQIIKNNNFIELETVGKITLYDDGAFFYIGHADNPKVCKIDRDIGLWCNLKADMKRYGVLRYKKKTGLCFDKRKGKLKSMSFPAYLYARYNGLPLKDMRGRAVRKKNRSTGDILDYTSSNLYVIGQGQDAENFTRTITVVGDKIVLTLKSGGVYFATHNELLRRIVIQNKVVVDSKVKGRLGLKVHTESGYYRFYFYDLAFACYHGYVTTVDNMIQQLEAFREYKRQHNLDVDHADSNVYNNTILNLSLMDHTLNSAKASITAEFVGPYHITALYHEGVYRVQLVIESAGSSRLMDIAGASMRGGSIGVTDEALRETFGTISFACANDREFFECLRFLANIRHSWADKGDCTPKEFYKQNPDFDSLATDTQYSIRLQEALLVDKVSYFQDWA